MGLARLWVLAFVAAVAGPAEAEWALSGFLGASFTSASLVSLSEPGFEPVTLEGVSWAGESFESPPYYSLRVTRFLDSAPGWGIAVDFTHAKALAELEGPARDVFSNLQFSHGHNVLTLSAVHRWRVELRRLQPYVGFGAGVAIPHVEVATTSSRTEAYRLTGPAAQVFVGVRFALAGSLALATEYRFGYARIDAGLDGGGTLATNLRSHHVTFGVSLVL